MSSEINEQKAIIDVAFEIEERRFALQLRKTFSVVAVLLAVAAVVVAIAGASVVAGVVSALSVGLATAAATGVLPRKRP